MKRIGASHDLSLHNPSRAVAVPLGDDCSDSPKIFPDITISTPEKILPDVLPPPREISRKASSREKRFVKRLTEEGAMSRFYHAGEGKLFLIYQLGTNNWQRDV